MEIDITELEKEAKRRLSLIFEETIRVQEGKLSFSYAYAHSLPAPFDSYYDADNSEFHVIIQRDAFPGYSCSSEKSFILPEGVKKIKVNYQGKNLDNLTDEESIEHFFPNLKAAEGERHKDGIYISGEDGWLNPNENDEE